MVWSQVCGPSCDSWVLDSSDARLRHPDALASGRTLSFCHRGSLPCEFVRTWVGRPRPCLGSCLLLVVFPFPCPGFRLAILTVGWSRHLLFYWALPWVLPSHFQCWLLAGGGWGLSVVVLPPWLRCGGCYPGYLSGSFWLALVELLCLWPPGSCGVPSLDC